MGKGIKKFGKFLAVLALLAVSAQARADDAELPSVLQQLKDKGGAVDFLGHSYGVDGWRVVRDGNQERAMYAYTTPEGGVLLGVLIAPDGSNETGRQVKAYKEKADGGQAAAPGAEQTSSVRTEKLYAEIEKSGWARLGDENAPYLYIFINTLCDHCQAFWKELEGPVRAGKLQVRLVPFGKVEENRQSGAALLSVDNPADAWNAFMKGDKTALSQDKIKPGMLDKVDANTALFRDWKMQGPPFTMYRKPADGMLTAVVGKPANTMAVLSDMIRDEKK